MNRTASVVKMQLVNRAAFIWVPLIVLGGVFVVTWAIWWIIWSTGDVTGQLFGGGAQAPLWVYGIVGVQALTLTFPFSQAMSVTRREFYLGTLLTAALSAAVLAVIFVIAGFLETWTDGWGVNGHFFAMPWIWDAGPLVAGFFVFVLAMLFFVIGFWAATLYKRFGSIGLTLMLVGVGVLLVAALYFLIRFDAWGPVFEWFARIGPEGLTLMLGALALVLAVCAFPALRRAIP